MRRSFQGCGPSFPSGIGVGKKYPDLPLCPSPNSLLVPSAGQTLLEARQPETSSVWSTQWVTGRGGERVEWIWRGKQMEHILILQMRKPRHRRNDEMICLDSLVRGFELFKVVCGLNATLAMKLLSDVRLLAWVSHLTLLGVTFLITSCLEVMFC